MRALTQEVMSHAFSKRVFLSELMKDEQFINMPRVETILSRVCLKALS